MTDGGVAQVRREVATDAQRLWQVVTDWPRHGRHLPGTTLEVAGPPGVGQRVTATSALGPARVEDPMVVTVWQPPTAAAGRVRLEKRGNALSGWAEIVVTPQGPGRAELVWREQIIARVRAPRIPGTAGVARQLTGMFTTLMIRRLARRLAREAEAETHD